MEFDELKHIANIARLDFDNLQLKKFATEFQQILDFISQIDAIDLDNKNYKQNISYEPIQLRKDLPKSSSTKEEAIKNSTINDGTYFIFPRKK